MSNEDWFGEVDETTDDRGFHLDESEDTTRELENWIGLKTIQKDLESRLKEITKDLEACSGRLQSRMGEHRDVRASNGWMMRWVHKSRKGYTVAAKEWDAFEIRSPF
jgi:hypothetical protein